MAGGVAARCCGLQVGERQTLSRDLRRIELLPILGIVTRHRNATRTELTRVRCDLPIEFTFTQTKGNRNLFDVISLGNGKNFRYFRRPKVAVRAISKGTVLCTELLAVGNS